MAFDTAGNSGSMIGAALAGSQNWSVPAGFDTEGFLSAAKANFVTLQAAWDKSDIAALRAMMTDAMLQDIQTQLAEREAHTGAPFNHTDVIGIEAHLLGIGRTASHTTGTSRVLAQWRTRCLKARLAAMGLAREVQVSVIHPAAVDDVIAKAITAKPRIGAWEPFATLPLISDGNHQLVQVIHILFGGESVELAHHTLRCTGGLNRPCHG